MVYLNSDFVITPLGEGAEENVDALLMGRSELRVHQCVHGERLVVPAMASLLNEGRYRMEGYTLMESLCISAVSGAVERGTVNVARSSCVFILSSTKGDIETPMPVTARRISQFFGNRNEPIVVSNACTSGVSAQVTAERLMESGLYDSAVVVGCDVQCEFIVSGFQSFRALSEKMCRPFDEDREGLNVGEAAACMILSKYDSGRGWRLLGGSIHNDANHISGPSRSAEGSFRCLEDAKKMVDVEDLAFVSVHGTGTLYNDEMEATAIHRAGLEDCPVSALKGAYGHTMGGAGVMETVLSICALERGVVLPCIGYEKQGTTYAVSISNKVRMTDKRAFVKLLSGFGGVNAAVVWRNENDDNDDDTLRYDNDNDGSVGEPVEPSGEWKVVAEVNMDSNDNHISNDNDDDTLRYDNSVLSLSKGHRHRSEAYRYRSEALSSLSSEYPKFQKMDMLSKLGFVGVERVLSRVRAVDPEFVLDSEKAAVVVGSRSSSRVSDVEYQNTIKDKSNYFPSPARFVYTLPNIVAGELAIRHKLFGETACYVLDNERDMDKVVESMRRTTDIEQLVVAWVECSSNTEYNAHIRLMVRD